MKIKVLLIALFVAGFAASLALASASDEKGKTTTGATTSTTGGEKKGCRSVSLRGTAGQTSFTMTVDKASKGAGDLKTATLTFSGQVKVSARLCAAQAGQAPTLTLRSVSVRGKEDDD
jgi:hypothetical protein